MELEITQIFYMKVVPEWYEPLLLSGEGTLEEQICQHEKERIEKDALYLADLKKGATGVKVIKKDVKENPIVHLYMRTDDGDLLDPPEEEADASPNISKQEN